MGSHTVTGNSVKELEPITRGVTMSSVHCGRCKFESYGYDEPLLHQSFVTHTCNKETWINSIKPSTNLIYLATVLMTGLFLVVVAITSN